MDTSKAVLIRNAEELGSLVRSFGLLPFISSGIDGFSVEAYTPETLWFVKGVEGPWEWREAIADEGVIAYGKVFNGKAGFVAPEYYPDLVNWRRKGLSFQERYAMGQIPRMEKDIMDLIHDRGPMLSRDLRKILGEKGFERSITALQMRTDLTVQRLEYNRDAFGKPYGWGIARFAPPEAVLGAELVHAKMDESPEASFAHIKSRVQELCPNADEKSIIRLLR